MNNLKSYNDCRGCLAADEYEETGCDLRMPDYRDNCPCSNCLVKIMCQDICDIVWNILYDNEGDKNEPC